MNKEKIKKFLKKNGKTIVAFGVGGTVGFCLAKYMRSEDRKMFDKLRKAMATFNPGENGASLIDDIGWAMGDAEYAEVHKFSGTPVTVKELGELLIKDYMNKGKNLENDVHGLIIFRDDV